VTRPLLIIFLTIFVNLVGFGIIIPLLPFYAVTFGASPLVIGLLFAVFSLCQLVAAPVLGDLSDRYGRRPVLMFSLAGTVVSFVMLALAHSVWMLFAARIVDGLSGGNISTARATSPTSRSRRIGRGPTGSSARPSDSGFILGPALSGVLSAVSYTAPIWAAAALTLVAAVMTWLWLPETVHRARAGTGNPLQLRTGAAAAAAAPANPGHRLYLLAGVRDLPDDAVAVRRAALRDSARCRPATCSPPSVCSARSSRADSSGRSSAIWATSRHS
jgi:MFS family permease